MQQWTLRKAMMSDAPALAQCIRATYARYQGQISDLPDVAGGLDRDIHDNDVWVAVSDDAKEIVGGLVLIHKDRATMVANVAVAPSWGGCGIGSALMSLAEKQANAREYVTIRLSTHEDMPESITVYENLGWHVISREGPKVRMYKSVSGPRAI